MEQESDHPRVLKCDFGGQSVMLCVQRENKCRTFNRYVNPITLTALNTVYRSMRIYEVGRWIRFTLFNFPYGLMPQSLHGGHKYR